MTQYIMREMCSNCIFRPGNLFHLDDGRLEEMCAQSDRRDSNVICHQSKGLLENLEIEAWCRGSVDRRPGQLFRIMERLGELIEVDDPAPAPPDPAGK